MNLLEVVRGGRKSFVQPAFWELEASRFALFGGSTAQNLERIENDFVGYAMGAFKDDPVVFGAFERRRQDRSQIELLVRLKDFEGARRAAQGAITSMGGPGGGAPATATTAVAVTGPSVRVARGNNVTVVPVGGKN